MDLFSLIVAVSIGALTFKHMTRFFRLLFVQLALYSFLHSLAIIFILYQKAHSIPLNNHWLYNISMLFECGLLLFAARSFFASFAARRNISVVFFLFVGVYSVELMTNGITAFANYSYTTECVLITGVYLIILYQQFHDRYLFWYRDPIVWACIGILVYFICNVPYLTLMTYFQERNPNLNRMLFNLVLVLSNIRYLLLAWAFWQLRRNKLFISADYDGR